jgi:hypothetical protein
VQCGPNSVALLTPVHAFTGCGARHRSGPTGGTANGMPSRKRTWLSAVTPPRSTPSGVWTSTLRDCWLAAT